MSIPVNQTIKEYNDEIKKINAKYEELDKLLGRKSVYPERFENYYREKDSETLKKIIEIENDEDFGKIIPLAEKKVRVNEKRKEDNKKTIELHKSAIKLMEKLLSYGTPFEPLDPNNKEKKINPPANTSTNNTKSNSSDNIQQTKEQAQEEIRQNNNFQRKDFVLTEDLNDKNQDYINQINNANSQEEVEKIKEEAINKVNSEREKKNQEYNQNLAEREKATGYEEHFQKLFQDTKNYTLYKFGTRDSENNEVLVSPPDPAAFQEIEELVKKIDHLRELHLNTPEKNERAKVHNEKQLELRKQIADKIKSLLEKKGSVKSPSPVNESNEKNSIESLRRKVIVEINAALFEKEAMVLNYYLAADNQD